MYFVFEDVVLGDGVYHGDAALAAHSVVPVGEAHVASGDDQLRVSFVLEQHPGQQYKLKRVSIYLHT